MSMMLTGDQTKNTKANQNYGNNLLNYDKCVQTLSCKELRVFLVVEIRECNDGDCKLS